VSTSQKLLLGAVGCGRVFERYHLPALLKSQDWKLVAVCEPLKERREWIHRFYPDLPAFESCDEFFKKPMIEAVLITAPPAKHFPLSVEALNAGLHVMVEKPHALNTEEAKKLLEFSQRSQRKLQIGFNRRFNIHYLALKKRISMIPHNHIQSISSKLIINPENWNAITSFLGKDSEGGGVFDDVASHQIDLIPWILGDNVESVRAGFLRKNEKIDSNSIMYDLKFNQDLIAKCEAGHGTRYTEYIEIDLGNRKLLVYPTGLLKLHRMPTGSAHIILSLRAFFHFFIRKFFGMPSVTLKSIGSQLSAFAKAVRGETGVLLGADAQSGFHSLKIIQACRKSNQSNGSWISLVQ
jgi:predicted dehydrogenase